MRFVTSKNRFFPSSLFSNPLQTHPQVTPRRNLPKVIHVLSNVSFFGETNHTQLNLISLFFLHLLCAKAEDWLQHIGYIVFFITSITGNLPIDFRCKQNTHLKEHFLQRRQHTLKNHVIFGRTIFTHHTHATPTQPQRRCTHTATHCSLSS